jgi:hypothetical protein
MTITKTGGKEGRETNTRRNPQGVGREREKHKN